MNQLKCLYISGDLLVRMFTTGNELKAYIAKGIPIGSKFVYAFPAEHRHGIGIVIDNGAFSPLNEGDEIPTLEPITVEELNEINPNLEWSRVD